MEKTWRRMRRRKMKKCEEGGEREEQKCRHGVPHSGQLATTGSLILKGLFHFAGCPRRVGFTRHSNSVCPLLNFYFCTFLYSLMW